MQHVLTLVLIGALTACSGGASSSEHDAEGDGAPVDRSTVVATAAVARGSVSDTLTTSATVESEAQADLLPIAGGTVLDVRAEEGDVVTRGQVLAVIDNATLTAGSRRASAEVARLEVEVTRLERLAAQGAISGRELTDARYSLDAARTSQWEAGRSSGETRLKSPIDGVVAARDLRVGDVASAGRRAFQIVDLTRLRVVAGLPERDLTRVAEGQSVRLTSAYDDDLSTHGTVARIAPVVDPTTGTFRVTIALDQNDQTLRPGQFVSVEVEVDRHDDVWVVPREAIVYEDGAPLVYRMTEVIPDPEDGTEDGDDDSPADVADAHPSPEQVNAEEDAGPHFEASRTLVTLGLVDANLAEITDGLTAADQVVIIGQGTLRDGARIRLADPEPPEAPPDAAAIVPAPTGIDAEG